MRRAPLAALAGLAAMLFVSAASCGADRSQIDIEEARRGSVVEVVDVPASVSAKAAVTLTAAADGTIATLAIRPGDRVTAGQVVATIDSPSAQARLRQAAQALVAVRRAGTGLGRGVDLSHAQRAIDAAANAAFAAARQAADTIADPAVREALLAQLDAAQRQYAEVAAAAVAAIRGVQQGIASVGSALDALTVAQRVQARQAYDLAKSTVDALTLRAPISGVVQLGGARAPTNAGSLADLLGAAGLAGPASPSGAASGGIGQGGSQALPGISDEIGVGSRLVAGAPVVTIVDTSALTLVAEVDETDVLLVTPGVTADVELDAAPGAVYRATVTSVDVLPTPSTRGGVAYRARLTLADGRYPDGRTAPVPRPGMSAVAHLRVREATDVVTVPAAAIFNDAGADAVWVVREGRARKVRVTVGVAGPDVVQIVTGVAVGDRVVVRGTDKVHDGQKLP